MSKQELLNLSYDEVARYLEAMGEKVFRVAQIFEWIYQKDVMSFDGMKNLPKGLREKLDGLYSLGDVVQASCRDVSSDGTTKFLFTLNDGERIETVLIPAKSRNTVCVSTQAGCRFACKFCASGIGGWKRNLTTAEIISQILHIKNELRTRQSGEAKRESNFGVDGTNNEQRITHVVFMGVGEPLDNYDNVMSAIRVINDKRALNIGARRITISTCGIVPGIKLLMEEDLQLELSVSLHGSNDDVRCQLMPINKKYPLELLMSTLRDYVKNKKRQITFEYVLIKDFNCNEKSVKELARLLKGIISKINLIPYNKVEKFEYEPPSRKDVLNFQEQLTSYGIHSTVRMPRGRDISAACGQLRNFTDCP